MKKLFVLVSNGGDGFHYDVLTVPDECTLASLGIHFDCVKD